VLTLDIGMLGAQVPGSGALPRREWCGISENKGLTRITTSGHPGKELTMTLKEFDRFMRRHRRKVSGLVVSMYVISGVTLIIGVESPQVQGLIHIAIGILHGLA
jgi:hypothetical protein